MNQQMIETVKTRVEKAKLELDIATAHRLQIERQLGSARPRGSVHETYEETQELGVARLPTDGDVQHLAIKESYHEALRLEGVFRQRYRKALGTYTMLQLHGKEIATAAN